jgi:hypothetical protein
MTVSVTMRFAYVHRIFVGVHTPRNPSDEEWQRHCSHIERMRHDNQGVVVYTQGGGPTSTQRQRMRQALRETPAPPTAILTESAFIRGAITSLNWFLGNQVAAFEPAELARALTYLKLDGEPLAREEIVRALVSLASELQVQLPAAIASA